MNNLNDPFLPKDIDDRKCRDHLADQLDTLSNLFDAVQLAQMKKLAASGEYLSLYQKLLALWKTSTTENQQGLVQAIGMAGMGAGLSSSKIAEDLS